MDKVAEILGRCYLNKEFRESLIKSLENNTSCAALKPYKLTKVECARLRHLFGVLKTHERQFGEICAVISKAQKTSTFFYTCSYDDCCDNPPCD